MSKKCLGVREDTGDKCNRSASSDSDYCFMHQSQESNQRLQYLDEDVYYCPQDGESCSMSQKRITIGVRNAVVCSVVPK